MSDSDKGITDPNGMLLESSSLPADTVDKVSPQQPQEAGDVTMDDNRTGDQTGGDAEGGGAGLVSANTEGNGNSRLSWSDEDEEGFEEVRGRRRRRKRGGDKSGGNAIMAARQLDLKEVKDDEVGYLVAVHLFNVAGRGRQAYEALNTKVAELDGALFDKKRLHGCDVFAFPPVAKGAAITALREAGYAAMDVGVIQEAEKLSAEDRSKQRFVAPGVPKDQAAKLVMEVMVKDHLRQVVGLRVFPMGNGDEVVVTMDFSSVGGADSALALWKISSGVNSAHVNRHGRAEGRVVTFTRPVDGRLLAKCLNGFWFQLVEIDKVTTAFKKGFFCAKDDWFKIRDCLQMARLYVTKEPLPEGFVPPRFTRRRRRRGANTKAGPERQVHGSGRFCPPLQDEQPGQQPAARPRVPPEPVVPQNSGPAQSAPLGVHTVPQPQSQLQPSTQHTGYRTVAAASLAERLESVMGRLADLESNVETTSKAIEHLTGSLEELNKAVAGLSTKMDTNVRSFADSMTLVQSELQDMKACLAKLAGESPASSPAPSLAVAATPTFAFLQSYQDAGVGLGAHPSGVSGALGTGPVNTTTTTSTALTMRSGAPGQKHSQ